MSEYLVEAYLSPHARDSTGSRSAALASAAEELTREGQPVRLLSVLLIPAEETCFYLFEASSSRAVVQAAARSGLQYERVLDARSDWAQQPITTQVENEQREN